MSVTVRERVISRNGTRGPNPSAELLYWIEATGAEMEDYDAVAGQVEADAPATFDGLVRGDIQCEHDGAGTWYATVQYEPWSFSGLQESGDSVYNFDTGGGTQHITHSLDTISKTVAGEGTAPDYKNAIGVSGDGEVGGVDIIVPVYNFSETHIFDDADVTGAYKADLFLLTGEVNNANFKGFSAGEVLFLGAAGTKRGDDDWEIGYRFSALPNLTDIVIGDITVPSKKGWEYIWVLFDDEQDTSAEKKVQRPRAAYVEKVYELGDMADLLIGT